MIHPSAAKDIRELMATDRSAAGKIVAFLEQAKQTPSILETLLDHDFGADRDGEYHVSKWFEHWNKGYNLWRVKIWLPKGSLPCRIIYAYGSHPVQYHVLAVVNRDFNYEPNHDISRRIINDYGCLGLRVH